MCCSGGGDGGGKLAVSSAGCKTSDGRCSWLGSAAAPAASDNAAGLSAASTGSCSSFWTEAGAPSAAAVAPTDGARCMVSRAASGAASCCNGCRPRSAALSAASASATAIFKPAAVAAGAAVAPDDNLGTSPAGMLVASGSAAAAKAASRSRGHLDPMPPAQVAAQHRLHHHVAPAHCLPALAAGAGCKCKRTGCQLQSHSSHNICASTSLCSYKQSSHHPRRVSIDALLSQVPVLRWHNCRTLPWRLLQLGLLRLRLKLLLRLVLKLRLRLLLRL
jgi:hypothetical protein